MGSAAIAAMVWVLIAGLRHDSSASEALRSKGPPLSAAAGPEAQRLVVAVPEPTIAPPQPDMGEQATSDLAPPPPGPGDPKLSGGARPARAKSGGPAHGPKTSTSAASAAADRPGPGF
jgi:hypothetical protein